MTALYKNVQFKNVLKLKDMISLKFERKPYESVCLRSGTAVRKLANETLGKLLCTLVIASISVGFLPGIGPINILLCHLRMHCRQMGKFYYAEDKDSFHNVTATSLGPELCTIIGLKQNDFSAFPHVEIKKMPSISYICGWTENDFERITKPE